MSGQIERTRIFLEVADHGSFAKAAQRLGLSRSAVTRQIAELERELGAQLLVRTTRRVSMTAAGALYAERCRPVLRDLAQASEAVREQQAIVSGRLRLSSPLSFGMQFLPSVVAQFRILHPGVTLAIDLSDRFVDILREDYDMALRISGPPTDLSTIWRKICPVPRLLVAAPGYLRNLESPTHPEHLEGHRCLAYSSTGESERWSLTRGEKTFNLVPEPIVIANNGELLRDLAIAGEGIALLPHFIVHEALKDGTLVSVLDAWLPPPIWLTAFFPPYASLPAKVATFTDFVEAVATSAESPVPLAIQR